MDAIEWFNPSVSKSLSRENVGLTVSCSKDKVLIYLRLSEEAYQRIMKDADEGETKISLGVDGIRLYFKPSNNGFGWTKQKSLGAQYKMQTKLPRLRTFLVQRTGSYLIKHDPVKKLYYAEMPINGK
jgi:hypothetical protein